MVIDYFDFSRKKIKIIDKLFDKYDTACDYDEVVVAVQQAIELHLKGLCEVKANKIIKTHKLTTLTKELLKYYPKLKLIMGDLSIIQDYYFDKRYPGEDYTVTDLEECEHAILILSKVIKFTKGGDLGETELF